MECCIGLIQQAFQLITVANESYMTGDKEVVTFDQHRPNGPHGDDNDSTVHRIISSSLLW